jgi:translation initiation factor IF-3
MIRNLKKPINQRKHKINSEVRFPQVRLVGTDEPIVMSSYEASKLAESLGKDLILINESQSPPIVRIEDYNKFIYDQEKAAKLKQKNAVKSEIKEIQLSPEIAINDLQTKSRKAKEFLEEGNKVRCVLPMKGRQKQMPERGENVLYKFFELLQDISTIEEGPKWDGGKWHMSLKQKAVKKT